jgi:hypothetical protein
MSVMPDVSGKAGSEYLAVNWMVLDESIREYRFSPSRTRTRSLSFDRKQKSHVMSVGLKSITYISKSSSSVSNTEDEVG